MTSSWGEYFLDFTLKKTNLLDAAYYDQCTDAFEGTGKLLVNSGTGIILTENCRRTYYSQVELTPETLMPRIGLVENNNELFEQLRKERRNVDLLEFSEEFGHFTWLDGGTAMEIPVLTEDGATARKVLDPRNFFQDFELKYNQPVTIIFGGNGIGKTACLNHIRKNIIAQKKNPFILFLDEVIIREFYKSFPSANVTNFMKYFVVDLTNPDVHIMYDNFERLRERDVIIDIMKKVRLNYRHVKQWVTCSDLECRYKLESKLKTFACFLGSIPEESQIKYLKSIWKIKHDNLDEYIKTILDRCNDWNWKYICKLRHSAFFGNFSAYPLHLEMIASAFSQSSDSDPYDVSLLDVYENFANSIYTNENIEELAVLKLFEYINHDFKFKTNVNLTPQILDFENVTNYLAAKWFSKNFHDYQAEFKALLAGGCTPLFQYFFNRFLCRGKISHLSALHRIFYSCSEEEINEKDAGGRTALHLAEDLGIMNNLLNKGASLKVKDDVVQWTPLQYCDYNGHLECLNILLERGADPRQLTWTLSLSEDEISKRFDNAIRLHATFYVKFICQNVKKFQISPHMVSELILKFPKNVIMIVLKHVPKYSNHYVDSWGETALFTAVRNNYLNVVQLLINKLGFDFNHRCHDNSTVFHLAYKKGFTDIEKYLLDVGIDIHILCDNNGNAFTDFKENNLQIKKSLARNGAAIESLASLERSSRRDINNEKKLIGNVKKLNITCNEDLTQLVYDAMRHQCLALAITLLDRKEPLDINKKFENGKTLLHIACRLENTDGTIIATALIRAGANVNATDYEGCTPIFEMLSACYVDIIELLAEKGCNLSHRNNQGETPLHFFTRISLKISNVLEDHYFDLVDLMKRIITYGADVNARTPSGDTPLHFACRICHVHLVRVLVSQGADIHAVNNKGETPLHLGCTQKSVFRHRSKFNVIQYLVTKGANINARTNSGKTPAMYAAACPSNFEDLINLGADGRCKDNYNKDVLYYFLNEHNLTMDQREFIHHKQVTSKYRQSLGYEEIEETGSNLLKWLDEL